MMKNLFNKVPFDIIINIFEYINFEELFPNNNIIYIDKGKKEKNNLIY